MQNQQKDRLGKRENEQKASAVHSEKKTEIHNGISMFLITNSCQSQTYTEKFGITLMSIKQINIVT